MSGLESLTLLLPPPPGSRRDVVAAGHIAGERSAAHILDADLSLD